MPKIAKELGALAVSRLKEPGLYAVGRVAGLHLKVSSERARAWVLRVKVGDKRRDIGLGSFPGVSLADARIKAQAARDKIAGGTDPILERRELASKLRVAQASEITFTDATKKFMDARSHEWKNLKHSAQWRNTLTEYAYPVIGKMFVRHITREHVLQVLEPIWVSKTETASRVRGRIENVLDWARVKGYRSGENPALWRGNLDHLLAKPSAVKPVKHHAALSYRAIYEFMKSLRAIDATGARCLEFTVLTASRSGESRGARWPEIDLDEGLWRVPAERMKEKKEHRVPLSTAAVELLRALPRIDDPDGKDLVFPSPRGKVMSDMTMLMLVRRLGVDATPHGMRSTFKDWASDVTNHPRELIEVALAHVPGDASEMSYWRSDVLERRRQLMEDWAKFISRPYETASVIPLQRQA